MQSHRPQSMADHAPVLSTLHPGGQLKQLHLHQSCLITDSAYIIAT